MRPYLFIATSFAGVLRRPVESALDRPVKPGDDDLFLTAPRFRSFSYAAAFMDK